MKITIIGTAFATTIRGQKFRDPGHKTRATKRGYSRCGTAVPRPKARQGAHKSYILNKIDEFQLENSFPNICMARRIFSVSLHMASAERCFKKLKMKKTIRETQMHNDTGLPR